MPSLDKIELFKSKVFALADEPAHRVSEGLSPELEIAPPESVMDQDLEDLLDLGAAPEEEAINLDALASSLGSPEDMDQKIEIPPEDDLFGGLFEDLPPVSEGFSTPEDLSPLEELSPEPSFSSGEDSSDVEDFSDSEALLAGFNDELSSPDTNDFSSLGGDFTPSSPMGFGADSLDQNVFSSDNFGSSQKGGSGESIVFDDLASGGGDFGFGDDSDFNNDFPELAGLASTTEEEVASFDSSGDADEFALGDFSSQFGLTAEETSSEPENLNPAERIDLEIAQSQRTLVLSDEEFKALQKSLSAFPLNLKQAVEEIIGEKDVGFDDLSKLIRLLVTGGSIRAVATLAGRLLGKTIKIPQGYAKGSGEELETSRNSLPYLAQLHMWPVLRGFIAATVLASVLLLLGYNFAYMPWKADSLYKEGHEAILQGNSPLGDEKFADAWRRWSSEDWVFKYAQAHSIMGEYERAQRKFKDFLQETLTTDPVSGSQRRYFLNYHKKALLAYHQLIAQYGYDGLDKTAHFVQAEAILSPIFQKDFRDREALLAKGDLFTLWSQVDGTLVERALSIYREYSLYHGEDNEVAFRRLKIYMLTDNEKMVLTYRRTLSQRGPMKIQPEITAELAGWLLDRENSRRIEESKSPLVKRTLEEELNPFLLRQSVSQVKSDYLEGIKDLLFWAQEEKPNLPDIHYQLARYFRMQDNLGDEEKALGAADYYFQTMDPILVRDPARTVLHIDTLNRIGEVFVRKQENQQAVKYFLEAKRRYEDALLQNIVKPQEEFGRIYSNLAEVYYTTSLQDWPLAGELFARAEENLYTKPEQTYKMGVIHYSQGQFGKAIDRFYLTENTPGLQDNKNNLYSLGNSLYKTGNYFGAMGYYKQILQDLSKADPVKKVMAILDESRSEIQMDKIDRTSLSEVLGEMPGNDRVYLQMLVRLWNNLGVSALKSRGARRQDSQGFVEAAGYISQAQILSDALGRREEQMLKGEDSMITINVRNMIGNWNPEDLDIYSNLPRTPWAPWL